MTASNAWEIIGITTTAVDSRDFVPVPTGATDSVRLIRSNNVPIAQLWMAKSSMSRQHNTRD